jgi:hypothetical protein
MTIERLYVICCRADVWFTRICIASIRYWYPDIPITLIKDETRKSFDTAEIEKAWNVDSRSVEERYGGWAMAHYDLLFNASERRFMFLDSDIVFVGPVLDALNEADGDIVVSGHPIAIDQAGMKALAKDYYDIEKLMKYDPDFTYPGNVFNCGAIVTGHGVFNRGSFGTLMTWDPKPRVVVDGIFQMADQGILNYVAAKLHSKGSIRLASYPFMLWSREPATAEIRLERIRNRQMPSQLIHWAGDKGRLLRRNPRTDILQFFEDEYYARLGHRGKIRRTLRTCILWVHQVRTDFRMWRKARSCSNGAAGTVTNNAPESGKAENVSFG